MTTTNSPINSANVENSPTENSVSSSGKGIPVIMGGMFTLVGRMLYNVYNARAKRSSSINLAISQIQNCRSVYYSGIAGFTTTMPIQKTIDILQTFPDFASTQHLGEIYSQRAIDGNFSSDFPETLRYTQLAQICFSNEPSSIRKIGDFFSPNSETANLEAERPHKIVNNHILSARAHSALNNPPKAFEELVLAFTAIAENSATTISPISLIHKNRGEQDIQLPYFSLGSNYQYLPTGNSSNSNHSFPLLYSSIVPPLRRLDAKFFHSALSYNLSVAKFYSPLDPETSFDTLEASIRLLDAAQNIENSAIFKMKPEMEYIISTEFEPLNHTRGNTYDAKAKYYLNQHQALLKYHSEMTEESLQNKVKYLNIALEYFLRAELAFLGVYSPIQPTTTTTSDDKSFVDFSSIMGPKGQFSFSTRLETLISTFHKFPKISGKTLHSLVIGRLNVISTVLEIYKHGDRTDPKNQLSTLLDDIYFIDSILLNRLDGWDKFSIGLTFYTHGRILSLLGNWRGASTRFSKAVTYLEQNLHSGHHVFKSGNYYLGIAYFGAGRAQFRMREFDRAYSSLQKAYRLLQVNHRHSMEYAHCLDFITRIDIINGKSTRASRCLDWTRELYINHALDFDTARIIDCVHSSRNIAYGLVARQTKPPSQFDSSLASIIDELFLNSFIHPKKVKVQPPLAIAPLPDNSNPPHVNTSLYQLVTDPKGFPLPLGWALPLIVSASRHLFTPGPLQPSILIRIFNILETPHTPRTHRYYEILANFLDLFARFLAIGGHFEKALKIISARDCLYRENRFLNRELRFPWTLCFIYSQTLCFNHTPSDFDQLRDQISQTTAESARQHSHLFPTFTLVFEQAVQELGAFSDSSNSFSESEPELKSTPWNISSAHLLFQRFLDLYFKYMEQRSKWHNFPLFSVEFAKILTNTQRDDLPTTVPGVVLLIRQWLTSIDSLPSTVYSFAPSENHSIYSILTALYSLYSKTLAVEKTEHHDEILRLLTQVNSNFIRTCSRDAILENGDNFTNLSKQLDFGLKTVESESESSLKQKIEMDPNISTLYHNVMTLLENQTFSSS